MNLRGINKWLILLAALFLVAACSRGEEKYEKCHKPQEYQQAKPGPRVRTPADMQALPADERLRLPYGKTQSRPIAKGEPCLAVPPKF